MKNVAIVLAAGSSVRFGSDKLAARIDDREIWQVSLEAFLNHPSIAGVGLVATESILQVARDTYPYLLFAVPGGATRTESAYAGLQAIPEGYIQDGYAPEGHGGVLIHDAARPYVTADLIERVCQALESHDCALPVVPVTDTVRLSDEKNGIRLLPRENLHAAQTPQGARIDLLRKAYAKAIADGESATDDIGLLQRIGVEPHIVEGDPANIKITHAHDLRPKQSDSGMDKGTGSGDQDMYTVTGFGYDTHRFSDDPNRPCWLGCLHMAGEQALDGHSDADVIAHAIVDALLGAVSLGDIGQLFPDDAPENKDRRSADFLAKAADLLEQEGAQIVHIDATYLGEKPKISNHTPRMREAIAEALGIDPAKVSLKATTNEKLGSIGAGEGAAAFAVATIRREAE